MNKILERLQFRRGTDLQRYEIILEEGEPVYTTDTKRVFIGTNKQDGGDNISNKNYILDSLYYPLDSLAYDIVYDKFKGTTYILNKISYNYDPLTSSEPTYYKIFDNGKECCEIVKRKIAVLKVIKNKLLTEVEELKRRSA
jgi:hypothetical protein